MLKMEETIFVPPPEKLKKVNLPEDMANVGFNIKDLEIYAISDPRLKENRTAEHSFPSASFIRVVFPFETNEATKLYMIRLDSKGVRIGRLLEIMDLMAGRVAYFHTCGGFSSKDITIVTAAVDSIQFYPNELSIERNITLDAYITYAGSSSMEVRIDVLNHDNKLHCSAYYVMVAREKSTGKAKKIPGLRFDLESNPDRAEIRYHLGKLRQTHRVDKSKNSLFKEPPNSDEIKVLHSVLKDHMDTVPGTDKLVGPKASEFTPSKMLVPISSTLATKTVLKHVQDRNIHKKIFGGLLMRESLELAYVCANLQGFIRNPQIFFIDDIYFLKPVDIGSIVRYSALITYAEGTLINVKVIVELARLKNKVLDYDKATEFNMVMRVDERDGEVVPNSYAEAMMYLEARRRIKQLLDHN